MSAARTAVVGAGVQGDRHAAKLAALPGSELVAVVDCRADRAEAVARRYDSDASTNPVDLVGTVDAAVLATPTSSHFELAGMLLENGIHLLIEKPITATVDEARQLVELAERNSLVLQVGHLERFNPVVAAIAGHVTEPQFMESNRIAPYKPRALDVSVVLDLMIHDIDLIHSFVRSPMVTVDAVGRAVFSDSMDIANARIHFANGCIANVTSSRSGMKTERFLRLFEADSYISADLHNKAFTRYYRKGREPVSGPDDIAIDRQVFEDTDAMLDQARAFLESIAGGQPPLVDGRIGMQALEVAIAIGEAVRASQG